MVDRCIGDPGDGSYSQRRWAPWRCCSPCPRPGPARTTSSEADPPDLVADLRGQIRLELVGRVVPSRRGFGVAFADLPDAPLRRVVLRMRGGAGGLLVAGADLCRTPARTRVATDGHDGGVHDFSARMGTDCGR